jgi:hypothetical protein
MKNSILQEQDQPEMIRLLKAQRVAYSKIKVLQFSFEVAAVVAAIALPICILFFPTAKTQIGYVCAAISISAFFAENYFKRRTKEAASIQEKFDRTLFRLADNTFKKPIEVSNERVIELSMKYGKDDMKGWYSQYVRPEYPMDLAVLLCQKINLVWDWKLRNKYRNTVIALTIIYAASIVFSVYVMKTTKDEFLNTLILVILSNVGLLRYLGSVISEKRIIIKEKQGYSITVDKLLAKATDNDPSLIDKAHELQNTIFESRMKHHKVPDCFARLHRPKLEILIDEMVSQTVSDYYLRQGK